MAAHEFDSHFGNEEPTPLQHVFRFAAYVGENLTIGNTDDDHDHDDDDDHDDNDDDDHASSSSSS